MKFSLFVLALVIGASSAFLSSSDKSMLDLDSSCGKGTALRRKRIIGGSASAATNHGWHVLIKDANGMNKCGGSLIHDYWVVTAASCVSNNLNPSSYTLEFGIVDRNAQWSISNNFKRKGQKIFVHPAFDRVAIRNDIALIKLDVKVSSLSSYQVEKICVPTGTENYQDRYGYATGFGEYFL
jgi:secreted trypsin-like serine protease